MGLVGCVTALVTALVTGRDGSHPLCLTGPGSSTGPGCYIETRQGRAGIPGSSTPRTGREKSQVWWLQFSSARGYVHNMFFTLCWRWHNFLRLLQWGHREDAERLVFPPELHWRRQPGGEPGLLLRFHPAVLLSECTNWEVRGPAFQNIRLSLQPIPKTRAGSKCKRDFCSFEECQAWRWLRCKFWDVC